MGRLFDRGKGRIMGTVYRETYTKPLPSGAEVFTRKGERFARWTDRRGRKRAAKVTKPAESGECLELTLYSLLKK